MFEKVGQVWRLRLAGAFHILLLTSSQVLFVPIALA